MTRFPKDAPRRRVVRALGELGFEVVREGSHIAMRRTNDDGSHGTRTARSYALAQIADTLHDLGFRGPRAAGLKRKHVAALVGEWKRQGRSVGTVKNRMAHVRWWAKHIGRPGVVPSNGALGIRGLRVQQAVGSRDPVLGVDGSGATECRRQRGRLHPVASARFRTSSASRRRRS